MLDLIRNTVYKHGDHIETIATKIIPKLRDHSYEERLKECGLTTLDTRRLRGDQIEVFKILNRYENIDRNMFSHSRKIVELKDIRHISQEGGYT